MGSTRPDAGGWILRRSVIAGAVAGAAGSVVLLSIGQPQIRRALAIEAARGGRTGDPLFSRPTQVVGGVIASVVFGLFLGLIFGVAFMLLRHRVGLRTDLGRTLTLASCGFVAVSLIPFLKYPSNPPAVGDPETVSQRTWGYIWLIIYAVLCIVACWLLANNLRDRGLAPAIQLGASALLLTATFAVAMRFFPAAARIPDDMPTDILWRFRLASLGQLFVTWMTLGLALGWLCDRSMNDVQRP